jgi:hypothetical protein
MSFAFERLGACAYLEALLDARCHARDAVGQIRLYEGYIGW